MKLESVISQDDFITSYPIARGIADQAVNAYSGKWDLVKACQDHIRGERPVKPSIQKKKGLGWASNDNLGKARAQVESAVQRNTAKMNSAIALGYPTFRAPEDSDKPNLDFLKDEAKRGVVASYIGYAFTNTLMKEHRLSNMLVQIEYPSYSYGYTTIIHVEDDWVPDIIHPSDIAFRPKTDPTRPYEFVVFKTVSAKYLWERWEECNIEDQPKEGVEEEQQTQRFSSNGWSKGALEELLLRVYNGKETSPGNKKEETWNTILAEFNTDCNVVISNSEDVTLAKIYYRELDGTFTICYIPYNSDRSVGTWKKLKASQPNQEVDLLLFKKQIKKADVSEIVNLVRNNAFTETSFIEDYAGLMKFAVLDSMRYNTMANDTFNKLRFSGSPWFEQTTKIAAETFKLGVHAGFVVAPLGFNLTPNQPKFDIQPHLTMMRFMQGEYNALTEHYDASLSGRLSSRPNKSEVQAQSAEVAQLDNSTNTIRYSDYSQVFFEMLKKICRININSVGEELIKSGIERFFKEVKKLLPLYAKTDEDVVTIVKAIDSYTINPVSMDIEAIMMAMQMAETPFARNRYKRMLLLAKGHPIEEVNIAVPLASDKMAKFDDERIAIFENSDFALTNESIVQGTDDHIVHLNTHLAKGQRTVQAYKQGQLAPDQAYKYMENLLAHSIQHFELLIKDPVIGKEQEKVFRPVIAQLNQEKSQMMLAAQKIMDAQAKAAQEQQLDPKTQSEIARKNAQAVSKDQRADQQSQNRFILAQKELDQKHALEREKLYLDHGLKQEELSLDQQNEQAANTTVIP